MLPFLKKTHEAAVVDKPDEKIVRKSDDDYEYDMLESAAEDLMSAIKSGDAKAVASALKAAFEICDAQPHEEGKHI